MNFSAATSNSRMRAASLPSTFSTVLLLGVPQRAFEQAVEELAVLRAGHALVALGAAQVDRGVARAGCARRLHRRIVGRAHRLAVDHGVEHRQHLAGPVGLEHVGAELVADPERVADHLEAFDVEIGAGQVALCGVLVDDAERHLLVGVVQEDGLVPLDLAGRPVDLEVVEIQHRVGRVVARAEAVVGEHPERAVGISLMPEWPCSGWPLNGSDTPVGRSEVCPSRCRALRRACRWCICPRS